MTSRRRDLTGFGFDRPSRDDRVPPPPPRRPEPRSAPPEGKKRITLSLPTKVARQLRKSATDEARYYLDIIRDSFLEFADQVDEDLGGASRHRPRRSTGRTQIPLNILVEDLTQIDQRARLLQLDRSAYVTELLIRSLG